MKKIKILLVLLLTLTLSLLSLLSCVNNDIDIVNDQKNYLNEKELYFNNVDTSIIYLNIFSLRYQDFKCYFNISDKPIKFEIYSSNTLLLNMGYNGSKIYQSELDSFLNDHNLILENIKNYSPFYLEQDFNIGGMYSSITIYVYNPLGGEWSFMWESI